MTPTMRGMSVKTTYYLLACFSTSDMRLVGPAFLIPSLTVMTEEDRDGPQ